MSGFSTKSISGGGLSAGSNITELDGTADRVVYVDSAGDVQEVALGASGTYLKSQGTTSAPTFDAVASSTVDSHYYFVAATDASAKEKALADYTCDGTDDHVQINSALSDVQSSGGKVILSSGTFTLGGAISLAGATANADGNPQVFLWGSGIDATSITGAANTNVINLTDQPKYDIGWMTITVNGTGNGFDQQAGTERGNWQSHIHDLFIAGSSHTGWGMYMESPFRMRFSNIEMNVVGGGCHLTSHTESFNPGNLSIDRMFIDMWNDASNSNGTAFFLTTTATTSTGHMNLVDVNRLDIYGGSNIPASVGIHLRGATADPGGSYYGEVRQNSFHQMNIEDVDEAIKLEAASDNSFTDINYVRVLDGGTVVSCDDESLNNLFENLYLDSNQASTTVLVVNDAGNDSSQPNVFKRFVGFSAGTATLNGTVVAATVIEDFDLNEGSPTVDSDLNQQRSYLGDRDFGSADSLTIPNGAGGTTVNASGEICADTTSRTLNFYDGTSEAVIQPIMSKSITIEDPTSSEDISMFFVDDAVTVTKMVAVLVGSATPSVTWTVRHGTDRSGTGAEVVTSGTTTTSVSTGSVVTSFNDATVVADSFIWLETTAQSGTVDELNLTIFYRQDA